MKLVAIILVIAASTISTTTSQGITITFSECSENQYAPGDPYGQLLQDLTDALIQTTPTTADFIGRWVSTDYVQEAYGRAQCNDETLNQDQCSDCLSEVARMAPVVCPNNSKGVNIETKDCEMRYDDHQFWED